VIVQLGTGERVELTARSQSRMTYGRRAAGGEWLKDRTAMRLYDMFHCW